MCKYVYIFRQPRAIRNIVRRALEKPISIKPRGGVDSAVPIGDVLMLVRGEQKPTCLDTHALDAAASAYSDPVDSVPCVRWRINTFDTI